MASNVLVKPIALRIDGVKVAEATGGSFKVNGGTERVPISDGTAFTNGAVLADLTFKTVVPFGGMRARLMEAVVAQRFVTADFEMDSKAYKLEGKLSAGGVDWEVASGKLDGDWTMLCGKPELMSF